MFELFPHRFNDFEIVIVTDRSQVVHTFLDCFGEFDARSYILTNIGLICKAGFGSDKFYDFGIMVELLLARGCCGQGRSNIFLFWLG
jgi:hypothetical protein